MGCDTKKSALRGEIFDQRVKKSLTAAFNLSNRAQRGMHQDNAVARCAHFGKSVTDLIFRKHFQTPYS
jgi:hypothetical protein